MAPVTRQGPDTPPNNINPNNMTPESVQAMIDQALLRITPMETESTVQTGITEGMCKLHALVSTLRAALTWWNGQIRTLGLNAYTMTSEILKKKMTDNGLPDNIYGSVKASKPKTLDETIELANDLMDQKLRTYAERQTDNKRKADDSSRNNHGHQQHPSKRKNVTKVYNMGSGERKPYVGNLPKCTKCHFHHNGTCSQNATNITREERECIEGPRLQCRHGSLINIVPTPLEISYDVELADGKIVRVDIIIRGCTLNFLNHPFNIDLMPIELGSFDIIISMDWLRSDESNDGRESRLTIISCSKAQEYMTKGCHIFLEQISAKREEDKSEGNQLNDVPIVRDFPKCFLRTFWVFLRLYQWNSKLT
nr:hypothetical protein [Tanacetum cinerariifolium]